jgi:hypothetical protein
MVVWLLIVLIGAWVSANIVCDWMRLGRESRAQWALLMSTPAPEPVKPQSERGRSAAPHPPLTSTLRGL